MSWILKLRRQTPKAVEASTPGERPDKVETAARAASALLLLGSVISGGALFLLAAPAQAEREVKQALTAPEIKPAKYARPNTAATIAPSPRRLWVDPPPLSPDAQLVNTAALSKPEADAAPVARTASAGALPAPTDCLPAGLRNVLKDVESRFGVVTLVSTTELHTDNHSRGSTRHKLHSACQAVDFKVEGNRQAVIAYLRSRPEVGGINSYGSNSVIHIDHAEPRRIARR